MGFRYFRIYSLTILIMSMFMIGTASIANAAIGTPEFCVTATTALIGAPGTVSPTNSTCVDTGSYVAITATAAAGANFGSWDLPANCSFSSGYENTANTRVTCAATALPFPKYTVSASFITTTSTTSTSTVTTTVPSDQFCVNASVYASGGGYVYPTTYSCATAGKPVSIFATANSGYTFSTWFLPAGCIYATGYGNTASSQVTCTASSGKGADYTVVAGFSGSTTTTTTTSQAQFCVAAVLSYPNIGGTVYPSSYSCTASGQSQYIYASPPAGYSFSAWNLPSGCTFASGSVNTQSTYVICAAASNRFPQYAITVQFTPSTTTVSPEFCVNATLYQPNLGGTIYPSTYSCGFSGQPVAISASPPPGYNFNSWSLPSGCQFALGYGNNASTQVVCNAGSSFPRYSITARFSSTASAPATATVTLTKGWNLFSVPLTGSSITVSSCSTGDLISPIWQFSNGAYAKASSIQGGYGYWVNVAVGCSITFTGTPLTISAMPSLNSGWNLIGSLNYSTSFTNVLGACNVLNGPFGFGTNTNSYYNASQMSAGNGYFVNVASSCNLGSSSNLPPSPP